MLHAPTLSQPLIRVNIYVTQAQHAAIFSYARALDISAAELTRRLIEAGLPKIAKQVAAASK